MTVHSAFKKKQKILVIFKDDREPIVARYLDTKSGKIITDKGEFIKAELRSTNIYKPTGR